MKKRTGRKGMQLTPEERKLLLEQRQEKTAEKKAEEKTAREEQLVESAAKAVVLILAKVPCRHVDAVLRAAQRAMEIQSSRYRKWKNTDHRPDWLRHAESDQKLREAVELDDLRSRASGREPFYHPSVAHRLRSRLGD